MLFTSIALTLVFSSNLHLHGEFFFFYGMLVEEEKTSNPVHRFAWLWYWVKDWLLPLYSPIKVGQKWQWSNTCGYLLGMEGIVILWELANDLGLCQNSRGNMIKLL